MNFVVLNARCYRPTGLDVYKHKNSSENNHQIEAICVSV